MRQPILILGGYGNFGKRIAGALVSDGFPVVIAGRDEAKATALKDRLGTALADIAVFDAFADLDIWLERLKPVCVINTCGPFQNGTYEIAHACIRTGTNYIDLADGREFVRNFASLNADALRADVALICGASTVPGLSSAVIEYYRDLFAQVDDLTFGISPGQKAERGLATTRGILSYVGKPLSPSPGSAAVRYGWQDIYRQTYPHLGSRWMANCDIPDLDLLPERYGLSSIRFSAGMELGLIHIGLWGLSWLVRLGVPLNLAAGARPLLAISNWFDRFGSSDGGMHMIMSGRDHDGAPLSLRWFIVAKNGHGPHIPTAAAIVLAKQFAEQRFIMRGALPCVGLVRLEDYLSELSEFDIVTHSSRP